MGTTDWGKTSVDQESSALMNQEKDSAVCLASL